MSELTYTLEAGRLVVRDGNGQVLLDATAEARLSDGLVLGPEAKGNVQLEWQVERIEDVALRLRLTLRNASSEPVRVVSLTPLLAERGFAAVPITQVRISQTGWQSWSRTHPLGPFTPNERLATAPIRISRLAQGARMQDSQLVPWMAVLADGDRGVESHLLVGFESGKTMTGFVELWLTDDGGHAMRAWEDAEGTALAPGASMETEPLLVMVGPDEASLQAKYAAQVAAAMGVRPTTNPAPTGWCSWYEFFTAVTEPAVHRNVEVLAAHRDRLPVGLVQLDDGYQREVGDWLDVKPQEFPSGMRALADEVRSRGFTPGLWIAPFLLSARSRIAVEHPEWLVREEDGRPINAIDNWGCENYALDTTHPDALAWVEHVVRTAVHDWGFQFLKLDFLYAGGLVGARHDRTMTSVQAYRRGMEAIRRAVGDDVFLLGCGAPLLPSIGYFDAMRIGSDVAARWRGESPPGGAVPGVGPGLANATRSTIVRGWMHRAWWVNDPDCVLVREHDSTLTDAEIRAWASVVALSGGMVMLGDDLSALSEERLALLGRLFPPHTEAAPAAFPPLSDEIPERLRLHVERPWGTWNLVGVANWSDEPKPLTFDASEVRLPAGEAPCHVVDQWAGEHRIARGAVDLGVVPAHGLRLLSVRPVVQDRPHVVGTTGHLLGDAVDVLRESWDEASSTLEVQIRASRDGDLLVWVPEAFGGAGGPAGGAIRRVSLKQTEMQVNFTRSEVDVSAAAVRG